MAANDQAESSIKSVLTGEKQPLPKELRLHRVFEQALMDQPEAILKTAIRFQDASKTYREVNVAANLLARAILFRSTIRQDSKKGQTPLIAVCMEPSDKLIILLLAILKTGSAYVAIDPTFSPNRISHILENSTPSLVIYHNKQPASLQQEPTYTKGNSENIQIKTENYGNLVEWAKTSELSEENLQEEEAVQGASGLACVLYTSGSTGNPKGVMLAHDRIMNRLLWGWRTFPLDEEEVCCFKTNLTFVDSIAEIFGPILMLRQLVVLPVSTVQCIADLLHSLREIKCRRLILVPSLLRSILLAVNLLPKSEDPLPDLKLWICSGERLPNQLLDQFFSQYPSGRKLCNLYGSTEVTADVTYATFTGPGQGLVDGDVPIGVPVDNTSIYLVDENIQLVPMGRVGEICIGGSNVNPGYLNEISDISLKFIKDPFTTTHQDGVPPVMYRTGDFGRIIEGALIYEGRTDSQVKIRGQLVNLSEVESAMLTLPGVDKAVVLVRQPKGKDEAPKLIGFYALTPEGPSLSFREVVTHLRACLSSVMMPLPFPVKSIPLLHNGKVDRQMLMTTFETHNDTLDSEHVLGSQMSPIEEDPLGNVLLDTVSAVVGIKNQQILDLDNNFYDMGGDSLNSILFLTELQNSGCNVQLHDLVTSPSLRDLIPKMKKLSPTNVFEGHTNLCDLTLATYKTNCSQQKVESMDIRTLAQVPREEAIHMIATSFAYKGQLECCVGTTPEDYHVLLNDIWQWHIDTDLSFGVFSQITGKLLAVCISQDFHDMKKIKYPPGVQPVFAFLEDIELPIRNKFVDMNVKVMHCIMMATAGELTAQENVMMITLMEETNFSIAKQHNYQYIVTTNSNPLTRDICKNMIGYKLFTEVYPEKYATSNGNRPFKCCSPDLTVEVVYKRIDVKSSLVNPAVWDQSPAGLSKTPAITGTNNDEF